LDIHKLKLVVLCNGAHTYIAIELQTGDVVLQDVLPSIYFLDDLTMTYTECCVDCSKKLPTAACFRHVCCVL